MFQDFTSTTRPDQGPPRLAALRAAMAADGIRGFLVPRADMYQGEYVAPADDRLGWLTGFTGSAGFCAVLADKAGLFVDGRYRLQGRAQTAEDFDIVPWPETKLADWLRAALPEGGAVGFDPWLHTVGEIEALQKALAASPVDLVDIPNLIDRIWADRPAPPCGTVREQPLSLTGQSRADKIAQLAADLTDTGDVAVVLTQPDSISWLLNLRGADIPRNPVVQCCAILNADGTLDLFIDPAKLGGIDLGTQVRLAPPAGFAEALAALTGQIRLDRQTVPFAVPALLTGAQPRYDRDPCVLPKACKTTAELDGTRAAHLRDGAAMIEFLSWLDEETQTDTPLTEIDVVTALEGFRAATGALLDISFDTICGAGPHGAIVHYRVTEDTNRAVRSGELLLVDSGGQYQDGTTDITRTMAIGTPDALARDSYTRVLQGVVAISRARWPQGLAGRDLDALARIHLWQAGRDFDHGTGHGVGSYLCVHEGPQRISRQSHEPLKPGMILSNEPGYYREGAFGIRIENLVTVTEAPAVADGDLHRTMLAFETLTYAPFDRALIDTGLLSQPEIDWIDSYHAATRAALSDRLSPSAGDWLKKATAPL